MAKVYRGIDKMDGAMSIFVDAPKGLLIFEDIPEATDERLLGVVSMMVAFAPDGLYVEKEDWDLRAADVVLLGEA